MLVRDMKKARAQRPLCEETAAIVVNIGAGIKSIPDTSSNSDGCVFAATEQMEEAGRHHAHQHHAEPRLGAPRKLPRVADPRGFGIDHLPPRKGDDRCRHGPQDRTPRYQTNAIRRDGQVPGRVSRVDDAVQQIGLR